MVAGTREVYLVPELALRPLLSIKNVSSLNNACN
jgi:hypothetical protein